MQALCLKNPAPPPPLPTVMDSPPTLPSTEPTSAKVVRSASFPDGTHAHSSPISYGLSSLPAILMSNDLSQLGMSKHHRRTDRHRHTRLLSLPQSRALLLHIRSMLSHSREVDGRALPMKKHFLRKLESHAEQPTDRESGPGERVRQEQQEHNRTDATTSLPASGIWLPPLPSGPTNTPCAASCLRFPGTTRLCPSRRTRPGGETAEQLVLNPSSTFLGYLKSCPRPFTGSR